LFGHLGYELGEETEGIATNSANDNGFADIHFFEPEVLISLSGFEMVIEADNPAVVWAAINCGKEMVAGNNSTTGKLHCNVARDEYIATIQKLREHIRRGDCYEINYCIKFFTPTFFGNPAAVYQQLSSLSPNPFSALYKVGNQWLLCASPERFIRKENNTIISQPIKGTAARAQHSAELDKDNRDKLFTSQKDRSENVMVVDLVRNDLSRVCNEGTVKVDELFGIYSFPQVHQMISTISGELKEDISFTDIIRATFPMGSMTGAPKRRVMELINKYEKEERGIFSGAVGYISPYQQGENGHAGFDFNVVIRSIIINAKTGYLSFPVGSGITFYSEPEKEWDECLLKAEAMRKALGEE
jgi:para-aminobenzoate synthetase component 1